MNISIPACSVSLPLSLSSISPTLSTSVSISLLLISLQRWTLKSCPRGHILALFKNKRHSLWLFLCFGFKACHRIIKVHRYCISYIDNIMSNDGIVEPWMNIVFLSNSILIRGCELLNFMSRDIWYHGNTLYGSRRIKPSLKVLFMHEYLNPWCSLAWITWALQSVILKIAEWRYTDLPKGALFIFLSNAWLLDLLKFSK